MTIFGITIIKASKIAEMATKIIQLQNCAASNSERAGQLKRQYDILKAERNKTVRELNSKIKALTQIVEFYENRQCDNEAL